MHPYHISWLLFQVKAAISAIAYPADFCYLPADIKAPQSRGLDMFDLLEYVFGFQVVKLFSSLSSIYVFALTCDCVEYLTFILTCVLVFRGMLLYAYKDMSFRFFSLLVVITQYTFGCCGYLHFSSDSCFLFGSLFSVLSLFMLFY